MGTENAPQNGRRAPVPPIFNLWNAADSGSVGVPPQVKRCLKPSVDKSRWAEIFYNVEMRKHDYLGQFEQLVLMALLRLGETAYGMAIRREIQERTGREVSIGAVYATLERLEEKGYVSSFDNEGGRERGGRARRFFRIRGEGAVALKESVEAVRRMGAGLVGSEGWT